MIWLISQSALWLLATMALAALAGWVWAAERAAPAERALKRQREALLRDFSRLGGGEGVDDRLERERETEAHSRLIAIRDGRIAELEHALNAARARADEAASRLAASERHDALAPSEEGPHARALLPAPDEAAPRIANAQATPADEKTMLQGWRLRYFEQRVRYLEGAKPGPAPESAGPSPAMEWRAREAEARAAHLEGEVRALTASKPSGEPFASNAEIDVLLRWRMLYLERRVAHLQDTLASASVRTPAQPDPEIWKWRARYLEARLRHLESRQGASAPLAVQQAAADESKPAPAAPSIAAVKPPVLSAPRNGLPDDFTLIDGLSGLQQSTLNALGVFHFDQIAAWTPEHVAWVDRYLYLRGRIEEEEWVEQASDLAREGVIASRRAHETEDA